MPIHGLCELCDIAQDLRLPRAEAHARMVAVHLVLEAAQQKVARGMLLEQDRRVIPEQLLGLLHALGVDKRLEQRLVSLHEAGVAFQFLSLGRWTGSRGRPSRRFSRRSLGGSIGSACRRRSSGLRGGLLRRGFPCRRRGRRGRGSSGCLVGAPGLLQDPLGCTRAGLAHFRAGTDGRRLLHRVAHVLPVPLAVLLHVLQAIAPLLVQLQQLLLLRLHGIRILVYLLGAAVLDELEIGIDLRDADVGQAVRLQEVLLLLLFPLFAFYAGAMLDFQGTWRQCTQVHFTTASTASTASTMSHTFKRNQLSLSMLGCRSLSSSLSCAGREVSNRWGQRRSAARSAPRYCPTSSSRRASP
eukprot:scaffold834_cov244-Pinguiococcus_pyrenoidosus.AAC.6